MNNNSSMLLTSGDEAEYLISYITSSYSVLYEYLSSPEHLPMIVRTILPKLLSSDQLINLMDTINHSSSGDELTTTKTQMENIHPNHKLFLKLFCARTATSLSEERAFELLQDYIKTELRDIEQLAFDELSLQRVIDFYFMERQRIVDCVTLLIHVAMQSHDDDYDNQLQQGIRDIVQKLLDRGLVRKAIDQLESVSNFEQVKIDLRNCEMFSNAPSAQLSTFVSMVTEQRLQEMSSLLELLLMIQLWFTGTGTGTSTTANANASSSSLSLSKQLFPLLRQLDFGQMDGRLLINVSREGHLAIARNTCLSLLILLVALRHNTKHNILQDEQVSVAISRLSTEKPHHALLKLAWITQLSSPLNDEALSVFWSAWFYSYPLLLSMFDQQSAQFPFLGHVNHMNEYRSIIYHLCSDVTSSSIFINTMMTRLPIEFYTNYCRLLQLLVDESLRSSSVQVTNEGEYDHSSDVLHRKFASSLQQQSVFKFLVGVFPARPHLLQLLALCNVDSRSAERVFNFLMNDRHFCCLENQESLAKLYFGELTQREEPANFQDIRFYQNIYCPFDYCVNQLARTIHPDNGTKFDKATCEYFLYCLEKMILYGDQNLIQQIDHRLKVDSTMSQISEYSETILYFMFCIIRGRISELKEYFRIISLSLKVIVCLGRNNHLSKSDNRIAKLIAKYIYLLVDRGIISSIIQYESSTGTYDNTVTFMHIMSQLVSKRIFNEDQLLLMSGYLCSNIFVVHDFWKYERLEQRWSLAFNCLQIFNTIAEQTFWNTHGCSEKQPGIQLMQAFLRDGNLYRLLFMFVGLGSTLLEKSLRAMKTEEAGVLASLIFESLQFLKNVLKYRKGSISQAMDKSTPLETLLFSQLVGKSQTPLIATIFQYMDSTYATGIRITSCQIIRLIAQLTEHYSPRPPSIVSYLGSQANSLVEKCLDCIRRPGEDSTLQPLQIAMFKLITTSLQIQKGLGSLFLKERNAECIDTILSIIYEHHHNHEILLKALSVILVVFQNGEDQDAITKLNNAEFWKKLKSLSHQFMRGATDNVHSMKILSYILNIFAIDLHQVRIFELSNMKTLEPHLFRQPNGQDNDEDLKQITTLINLSHNSMEQNIMQCNNDIANIGQIAANHNLLDKLNGCIVVKGGLHVLFNVDQLESIVGVERKDLKRIAEDINQALLRIEDSFSLFDAIYKLIAARTPYSPSSLSLFSAVFNCLKVSQSSLKYVALFEETLSNVYLIASKMLVCVSNQLWDPQDESNKVLTALEILSSHLQAGRYEVCENILLSIHLLMQKGIYDLILQPLHESFIGTFLQRIPQASCSKICLSILSLTVKDFKFDRSILAFAKEHLSNFRLDQPKYDQQVISSYGPSLDDKLVMDVLHFVLSGIMECENRDRALVNRIIDIIRAISTNVNFSASREMYRNDEQATEFLIWKVVLKIMCLVTQIHDSSIPDTLDDSLANVLIQFCQVHGNRLVSALVDNWNLSPRTLAIAEEAQLTSMLMHGLARLGLLNDFTLSQAVINGVISSARVIVKPNITPATTTEHKSEKEQSETYSAAVEELPWYSRVNVTLFGTLRALLYTTTYLTLSQNNSCMSSFSVVDDILNATRACWCALRKLRSHQFHANQLLSAEEAVQFSSNTSVQSASIVSHVEGIRLRLWSSLLGALSESIVIVYLLLKNWSKKSEAPVSDKKSLLGAEIKRTEQELEDVKKVNIGEAEVMKQIESVTNVLAGIKVWIGPQTK